ncbi:MAG: AAA family ATPase [Ruminococcus sp.]|nr:AAA family ATPase [Ruminococcus sp.]
MGKYIARLSVTYDFASANMQQLGDFSKKILDALPAECEAERLMYRFTFTSFTLTADNKAACEGLLRDAWKTALGDEGGISRIFVSELDDDEVINDIIKTVYNNTYGADEYISLVTELNDTIPMLAKHSALDVLRKQNYLIAADGGCGFTTLFISLGDYLHKKKIYPEEQYDSRAYYIEMKLGEEDKDGCASPDDVIDTLRGDSESNQYNIIGLDISYFLDGKKQDELRTFLRRLEPYQDSYVFAFRIPFLEKKVLDETAGILSDMMLLRVVKIPPLHDSVLMETVWNILSDRGFTPSVEIFETVTDKINREKMDGRFYGFKTAAKIAQELILHKSRFAAGKAYNGEEYDDSTVEPDDLKGFLPEKKSKATGYEAMAELIGMEEITGRVKEIVAQVKVSITNEKLDRPCIHMRFTGAPGTGKTTVARIIGQILREEGVLRKGGFFEYGARDLVAEYEGQTAVKTASICRDAYGSVLFIDEAYALDEGKYNGANFGKEALATLVAEMENHRDDMLVVMAGYSEEMESLMKVNPGLRSRMPYLLEFKSYTKEQLFEIFMQMVKKHFDYEPELEEQAKSYFLSLSDGYVESKEFANARFSRNLYERTWSKGALRCSLAGREDIVLTKEDFVAASSEKEFSEKIESNKKLGFGK